MALFTMLLGVAESLPMLLVLVPFPVMGVQLGRYHLRQYWTQIR